MPETIDIVGPKGRIAILKSELEEWLRKGYHVADVIVPVEEPNDEE